MAELIEQFIHQLRWRPTIGDSSVMGWITVGAYFLTAVTSFNAYKIEHSSKGQYFWLFMVLIMLFLGINKQLDLQSLLTDVGRFIAKSTDWYSSRRQIQRIFVVIIFIVSVITAGTIALKLGKEYKEYLLPLLGLSLLLGFIVIRAMSFHHVDSIIRQSILNIRINWVLELGGIGMILFPSLLWYKKKLHS